jgi:hypothetical protein
MNLKTKTIIYRHPAPAPARPRPSAPAPAPRYPNPTTTASCFIFYSTFVFCSAVRRIVSTTAVLCVASCLLLHCGVSLRVCYCSAVRRFVCTTLSPHRGGGCAARQRSPQTPRRSVTRLRFVKSKGLKQVCHHLIGSRVETGRFQAMGQSWIQLVQPPPPWSATGAAWCSGTS